MTLNNEQYERIARRLDGEELSLSAEESAAAAEIRAGETALGTALGEPAVPHRAMARAQRLLRSATARRVVVRARFIGLAAAGAAVAAALLIALALRVAGPPGGPVAAPPNNGIASAAVPVDVWLGAMSTPPGGAAIHLLSGEMDRFEADLAGSRPAGAMDRQMDSVQQDIDRFWTDDSSAETSEM
jgi:hypothetical protein